MKRRRISFDFYLIGEKVYVSTRRGTWVHNRVGPDGWPADIVLINGINSTAVKYVPWLANWIIQRQLNQRFDHQMYGLKPKHQPFGKESIQNENSWSFSS